MLLDALLSYLHIVLVFSLIVFQAAQTAVLRPAWFNAATLARVQRLARISNISIILVLFSGIARLYGGMLDSGWLMRNHLFHIKMALFLALVALGLPAVRAYQRWAATYASHGELPSEREINTARRWLLASSHLMLLIPLFAVLVARGYGSWGL